MVPPLEAEESAELHGQTWLWPTCDGLYNEAKGHIPRGGTEMTEPQSRGWEGQGMGDEDPCLFSESGLNYHLSKAQRPIGPCHRQTVG